jgi:hypothetical protein
VWFILGSSQFYCIFKKKISDQDQPYLRHNVKSSCFLPTITQMLKQDYRTWSLYTVPI